MLKMMLAYNDSNIVVRIKTSILLHNELRDSFSCLSGSDNDVNNQLLLTYIIERYANMQDTYFVRHMKGNSKNQIQKLAGSHATRTIVTHAVVYTKKVELDDNSFVFNDTPE